MGLYWMGPAVSVCLLTLVNFVIWMFRSKEKEIKDETPEKKMSVKQLQYTESAGTVKAMRGCIVLVRGLRNCINGQLIKFGYGTIGMIVGFHRERSAVVLIIKETEARSKQGTRRSRPSRPFETPVGNKFIGRILSPLCEPLDGLGPVEFDKKSPIFPESPPILVRQPLKKTLETGIKVLDAMIPIGLGQRELILGDKSTGKTTFVTDTILNQKNTDVICIYCAIGKPRSAMAKIVQLFKDHDCFKYTIIISAGASAPPGQQYLAPYVACSVAEHFLHQGKNVFVGFDDFTKHCSVVLPRDLAPAGAGRGRRDSYQGGYFYLHSKMIERACFLLR